MADDKTLKSPHGRTRLAMGEDYDVKYWANKFVSAANSCKLRSMLSAMPRTRSKST